MLYSWKESRILNNVMFGRILNYMMFGIIFNYMMFGSNNFFSVSPVLTESDQVQSTLPYLKQFVPLSSLSALFDPHWFNLVILKSIMECLNYSEVGTRFLQVCFPSVYSSPCTFCRPSYCTPVGSPSMYVHNYTFQSLHVNFIRRE